MSAVENGNTERLLGGLVAQIDNIARDLRDIKERQLHEIKAKQDKIATDLETRISALEINYASASGSVRVLILLCGAAAAIGGFIASILPRLLSH